MKTIEMKTVKRIYNSPEIVCIDLDKDISLALESSPPEGPGEGPTLVPEFMMNDSY